MTSCDNCDKEVATHFIRAENACPVYCDTNCCCACRGCDSESQAEHEEELLDSIEWSAPGAGKPHPMFNGIIERYLARMSA